MSAAIGGVFEVLFFGAAEPKLCRPVVGRNTRLGRGVRHAVATLEICRKARREEKAPTLVADVEAMKRGRQPLVFERDSCTAVMC